MRKPRFSTGGIDSPGAPAAKTLAHEFDALVTQAADIVVPYDRDLRHLFINDAVESVSGVPAAAFIGRTNRELAMPEALCALWDAELGAVFADELPRRFEFSFDGPHGVHWLEAHVVPERNGAGEVETILSVTRDCTAAHHAQSELRESELRYRELFERASEMILVFDLDGVLAQVNPAVEQKLGYEAAELVGRPLISILAGECVAAAHARLASKIDRSATASVFETVMIGKDGCRFSIEASSEVVPRDGVPHGVMMIARDVSEQVATRAALVASERLFRGAFDGVAAGMVIADVNANVVRANAAFATMLGYEVGELRGRPVQELVHPDDAAAFHSAVARLRAGLESGLVVDERRYVRRDGEIVFAHVSVSVVAAADGSPLFLAEQIEDVTELRNVHADLHESIALREALVKVSPDVLAVIDVDGTLRLISRSAEEILGYTMEELLGRNFLDFVHPDDRLAAGATVADALRGGQQRVARARVIAKDGSIRIWDGIHGCSFGADGTPQAIVANLRDVTNQVSLEDQLRQAQKMEAVGQLAGGIAHDFNNLLTAIGGYAELVRGKLPDESCVPEIDGVIDATARAAALTAQLLAFSRRQVLNRRVFDLGVTVSEMSSMLRQLIPASIELVTILPSEPAAVLADRAQIEQVVVNLVVNAADAIPDDRRGKITVEVAVEHSEQKTLLRVGDNGIGMDALTAAQIFEPFFSTKGDAGTGLGLSIVHGIVNQSGAQITVESDERDGTTFTVTWARAGNVQPEPVPILAAPAGGRERLLLVEDDPAVRAVLANMLRLQGYQVTVAASGEEAVVLAHASKELIDLVITDMVLTGMNGRETADAVRNHQPQARVLFMSGYTDDVVIRAGVQTSATAFIQKPFNGSQLASSVRGALDATTSLPAADA